MNIYQIKNIINNKTHRIDFKYTTQSSSVLVIINSYIPKIIMIKRNYNLRIHGGEMAFPGGKCDYHDGDILDTAIRETKEEINLNISKTQITTKLNPVHTSTGFTIFPFVTIVNNISDLRANYNEVDTIFNIPLFSFFQTIKFKNSNTNSCVFEYQNNIIWGASARILKQLYDILNKSS